jgi:repressor LexA
MSMSSIETEGTGERAFASVLRQQRARLSLSLGELAQRVGCAKSYLSAIETGRKGPPGEHLIEKLEGALSLRPGELLSRAHWDQTPPEIREDLTELRRRDQDARLLAKLLTLSAQEGTSLDELYASGALRSAIERLDPGLGIPDPSEETASTGHAHKSPEGIAHVLPAEVPLINKVTAGYPADFTDLDYPARVADEYIRTPDLSDPDAFAARVVGDSMHPNYQEGDIVVFSPARAIESGADCFVRFERDAESTFKRVYFETDQNGAEMIRIQPINNAYPPRTVPREEIAGLYAGVSVIHSIG